VAVKRQVGQFLQRFATKQDADGESHKVDLLEKVLVELGARYKNRPGGYTRIIKIGRRRGDNAPMCLIELVDEAAPAATAAASSESTPG
jgi:ribosomal protein L17